MNVVLYLINKYKTKVHLVNGDIYLSETRKKYLMFMTMFMEKIIILIYLELLKHLIYIIIILY